ncbi:hypothetical protein HDU96_002458 [Phlyctochytrium bullatum]|nr:hypothetical protein HDU96_002458 [Phlyctochytrium bullatum]
MKSRSIFSLFGRDADAATPNANVTPSKSTMADADGARKASSPNAGTSTAHHRPTLEEALNRLCHKGRTPLHAAVQSGSAPLVDVLRSLGGDPYRDDNTGTTPVDLALWRLRGQKQRQIFDVLLPDPVLEHSRHKDTPGEIPFAPRGEQHRPDPVLHILLRDPERPTGILARAVSEGKVKVDEVDQYGNSALHRAAVAASIDGDSMDSCFEAGISSVHAIRELLAIGADPRLKNSYGKIPLELADSLEAFEAFAEWMPWPHGECCNDVFKAAAEGDTITLKLALGRGEDLCKSRESDGMTALHCAAVNGKTEVLWLIRSYCGEQALNMQTRPYPRLKMTEADNQPDKQFVLAEPRTEMRSDAGGRTPLFLATLQNHKEFIDASLRCFDFELGVLVIDFELSDDDGDTPLHVAAWNGNASAAEMLLTLHDRDPVSHLDGLTPLYICAAKGHAAVMRTIFVFDKHNKVNVNRKVCNGETALHAACRKGNLECVQLLIWRKADVSLTRNDGKTALHLAAEKGHYEIARLLIETMQEIAEGRKDADEYGDDE